MDSQFRAVIFDFDGLLCDTEPTWDKTYYIFLKNHNVIPNEEVEDEMFGSGLIDAVQLMKDKMGLVGDTNDLVADYRKLFYEEFGNKRDVLMPGVLEILEKAKKRGLEIAMNSGGHTEEKLVEILKLHNIFEYFTVIISSDDVKKGKPAPDVYLETLKELKLSAEDCLAFEDSPNGVVAAVAARICVYGINMDEKTRNQLIKMGAKKVFASLIDVDL